MFSLNHLSAFTNNLTCNLEPIYGIGLGALIFHENESLNSHFYIGTSVIIVAIFAGPILAVNDHASAASDKNGQPYEKASIEDPDGFSVQEKDSNAATIELRARGR